MKTIILSFLLSVAMLTGGCYTQLALNDENSDAAVEPEPTNVDPIVVFQPPPIVVIIQPIIVPIEPPYVPPPTVVVSPPGGTQQKPAQQDRDFGNHRSGSVNAEGVRTIGSSRSGRN
ncbi:MAG: hypothetical protein HY033_13540 [Ignavibacteriae bacterium]|nr:hypothetical protein [Ignavibacteria bacterium]MBI3365915.1 hypothetical protein [Ignavibacteriota bacterium]